MLKRANREQCQHFRAHHVNLDSETGRLIGCTKVDPKTGLLHKNETCPRVGENKRCLYHEQGYTLNP